MLHDEAEEATSLLQHARRTATGVLLVLRALSWLSLSSKQCSPLSCGTVAMPASCNHCTQGFLGLQNTQMQ